MKEDIFIAMNHKKYIYDADLLFLHTDDVVN